MNLSVWFRDAPIKRKLLLIGLLTTGFALLFVSLILTANAIAEWRNRTVSDLTTYARVIGHNAAPAILFDDRNAAAEMLSALTANPDIVDAVIYDKGGREFARFIAPQHSPDTFNPPVKPGSRFFSINQLAVSEPVLFKNDTLGSIYLEADPRGLYAAILRSIGLIFLTALGVFTLAALLFARLQKIIVTPILDMTGVMQNVIAEQNFAARVAVHGKDEAGMLAGTFNVMLEYIQLRDAELGQCRVHLEEEVAQRTAELREANRLLEEDIIERKQTEQELRIAATAFETQEGIMITDRDNRILRVNGAFTSLTGYSAEEAVGKNPALLHSGRHDAVFYRDMWRSLTRDKRWQGEIWNRRKDGEIYLEWLNVNAVTDADGQITHYVAAFSDITLRKQNENKIHNLAFYDPLTQLPNRRLLMDRLNHALASGDRSVEYAALMFIDLDNFKTLNDTRGHDVGDLLLVETARRLQDCVREGDTVARLGGDEFVVMLEGLSAEVEQAASQAAALGEKIRASLNQPYLLKDFEHHSSSSIGIGLFRGREVAVDELLKRADMAMYEAKTSGRNALRFFDPVMQTALEMRSKLEADLRRAISGQGQFLLYYQAQVSSSGRVIGAEALARWIHPGRGMVSPAEFIPLAEETGLILPLGHWVLATACQQLVAWAAQPETAHLTLAVNVSAKQFHQPTFVEEVLTLVDHFGVDTAKLKLEITESMLLDNVDDIIAKMTALKARGISFSMDDFGTGYSSLSYLKRLPLYQLKIDQSFVHDVLIDPNDAAIARIIVALANTMNLAVIAEGVETEEQREFLDLNGCHTFQGYLFSKPVPVKEFEQLIEPKSRSWNL